MFCIVVEYCNIYEQELIVCFNLNHICNMRSYMTVYNFSCILSMRLNTQIQCSTLL